MGRWRRDTPAAWQGRSLTHLFEIISPVTSIVVNYPFSGLVHLATLETQQGEISLACPWDTLPRKWTRGIIKPYGTGQENPGRVCAAAFRPVGLRLKMIFDTYRDLHALYTRTSAHTLWKQMYDGNNFSGVLTLLPDELKQWASRWLSEVLSQKNRTAALVEATYRQLMYGLSRSWGKEKTARDKAIGMALSTHPLRAFLLPYHKYQETLWKSVEPEGSDTFRREEET